MLWFLHLAAVSGVVVESYEDRASARAADEPRRLGRVHLGDAAAAGGDFGRRCGLLDRLHHRAHEKCFVARSLNFAVACEPSIAPTAATA